MAFGAVRILDVNGLSYLYTKLNNNITDFQNTSKAIIDSAAAAANNAAERANAITGNIDSTYATKEELTTAIGKITSFEFLIVSSLPNPGVKGTIYLVENTSGNQSSAENKNTYDEFIWVGSKYEKIGTTDINLSDYMKAADIADTYLSKTDASTTYATKGEVSTLDSKVDANTVAISKAVSTVASQGLTDTEKSNARANINAAAGNHNHDGVYQPVGSYAAANHGHDVTISAYTNENYMSAFRTQTKGNSFAGDYISVSRNITNSAYGNGLWSPTIAWGKDDTHGYLHVGFSSAEAYVGGGSGDQLHWVKQLAFSDHNHDGVYLPLSGNASSATRLATARNIALSGAVTGSANFDGSANINITTKVAYGTWTPSSLADGQLYCVYE